MKIKKAIDYKKLLGRRYMASVTSTKIYVRANGDADDCLAEAKALVEQQIPRAWVVAVAWSDERREAVTVEVWL